MPATAGRVRMPADNRVSVSASLRTSEIWQKSVGYDPYAPVDANPKIENHVGNNDKAKGLFELARLTGASSSITPGACRKCGQVGHLTHQCRNFLAIKGNDRIKVSNHLKETENDERKLRKRLGLDLDGSSSDSIPSRSRSPSSLSSIKKSKNKNKNLTKSSRKHKNKKRRHGKNKSRIKG